MSAKVNVSPKNEIMSVVIKSILYLFGMGGNPLSDNTRISVQSDFDAISSEWRNVGMDIQNAMLKYEK